MEDRRTPSSSLANNLEGEYFSPGRSSRSSLKLKDEANSPILGYIPASRRESLESKLSDLIERVRELEESKNELQNTNVDLQHQNEILAEQKKELERENSVLENRRNELEVETYSMEKRLRQSSPQPQTSQEGSFTEELRDSIRTNGVLEERMRQMKVELDGSLKHALDVEQQLSSTGEKLRDAQKQIFDLRQTVDIVSVKLQDAEAWTQQVKNEYERRLEMSADECERWRKNSERIDSFHNSQSISTENMNVLLAQVRELLSTSVQPASVRSLAEHTDQELAATLRAVRDGFERFSHVFEDKIGCLQEELRGSVLELRSCLQPSPPPPPPSSSSSLVDLTVVKQLLLQTSPSNDDILELLSRMLDEISRLQSPEVEAGASGRSMGAVQTLLTGVGTKVASCETSVLELVQRTSDVSNDRIGLCFRHMEAFIASFHESTERLLEQVLSSSVALSEAVGTDLVQLVADSLKCMDEQSSVLDQVQSIAANTERGLSVVKEELDVTKQALLKNQNIILATKEGVLQLLNKEEERERNPCTMETRKHAVHLAFQRNRVSRSLLLWCCAAAVLMLQLVFSALESCPGSLFCRSNLALF